MMKLHPWKSAVAILLCSVTLAVTPGRAQTGNMQEAVRAAEQIDQWVSVTWKEAGVTPAAIADDATFFRRLYLDLIGTIPPPDEIIGFLRDTRPEKRRIAVEFLLNSPQYAEYMATVWENVLVGRRTFSIQLNRQTLHEWLRKAVAENRPYDQFVRELITATGTNEENGAVSYTMRFATQGRILVEDLTGHIARTFLGTQIQCAQCHDHKTEAWKQVDFHGMAAFFARTRGVPNARPSPQNPRPAITLREVPVGQHQMELHSGEKQTIYPRFLNGPEYTGSDSARREALAQWITAKENPWFARAAVNRTWGMLMGRGIVDPIDDLRESNPPSHPELLQFLADDFRAHNHDVKHLLRSILYSRTYQLSSRSDQEPDPLKEHLFLRARLRQMTPEQLFNSLYAATGIGNNPMLRQRGGDFDMMRQRLLRLFVLTFDTDEAEEADAFDGTIPQALMLMNGELSNRAASAVPGMAMAFIANASASDRDKLSQVFLRTVSRLPTARELARLEPLLQNAGAAGRTQSSGEATRGDDPGGFRRRGAGAAGGRYGGGRVPFGPGGSDPKTQALEDVFWALLNSSEFVFNH